MELSRKPEVIEEVDFLRTQGKKSLKEFIWNGDSKEFLGRTGVSWGKNKFVTFESET